MKQTVKKISEKADGVYSEINQFVSESLSLKLSDFVYPNHDGQPDHEAAADLETLRQSLYSLSRACQVAIEHLTFELDQYNENEKNK